MQMIYFAIRCTENYKSDNVVVGIYTSVDRAINRIEDLCDSRRKTGAFSTYCDPQPQLRDPLFQTTLKIETPSSFELDLRFQVLGDHT